MFTNEQALEAARLARSRLAQMLNAESAQQVDHQLAQLLNQTDLDENTQADRLLEILDSHPETKAWLDDFLKNKDLRSYSRPPGNEKVQPATKYVCPIGNDYNWSQEDSGAIPLCPTHLVPLVPAQS